MAINKARTSGWTKALIIILIVSFVSLIMATGFAGLFDLFKSSKAAQSSATTTTAQKVAEQYDPQVSALRSAYESNATSYTAAINLANIYYDYAQALSTPGTGESTPTVAATAAALVQWQNAKSMYDKAVAINSADPAALVDRSWATFRSGETTAAYEMAKGVTVASPAFSAAWYNLGIYCENLGLKDQAIAAYKQFLTLEPKSTYASVAQARIDALSK